MMNEGFKYVLYFGSVLILHLHSENVLVDQLGMYRTRRKEYSVIPYTSTYKGWSSGKSLRPIVSYNFLFCGPSVYGHAFHI